MSVSAAMAMQGPTTLTLAACWVWPSCTVEAQDLCRSTKAKVDEKIEMELKTLNVITYADDCLFNLSHWLWYLWCLKPRPFPDPPDVLRVWCEGSPEASALFRLWNVHQKDVTVTLNSDTNHICRQPDLQARFDVTFAVDTVVKKNQIWVTRLIRFRPLELLV